MLHIEFKVQCEAIAIDSADTIAEVEVATRPDAVGQATGIKAGLHSTGFGHGQPIGNAHVADRSLDCIPSRHRIMNGVATGR
ncbi:hypothetical protein D3C71_1677940 [compost metagenome]